MRESIDAGALLFRPGARLNYKNRETDRTCLLADEPPSTLKRRYSFDPLQEVRGPFESHPDKVLCFRQPERINVVFRDVALKVVSINTRFRITKRSFPEEPCHSLLFAQ